MNSAAVVELVKTALKELNAYLENSQVLEEGMTTHQLVSCKRELEEILKNLKGSLPPKDKRESGMGRMIVDSWPFGTSLGETILKAERAYTKLP